MGLIEKLVRFYRLDGSYRVGDRVSVATSPLFQLYKCKIVSLHSGSQIPDGYPHPDEPAKVIMSWRKVTAFMAVQSPALQKKKLVMFQVDEEEWYDFEGQPVEIT